MPVDKFGRMSDTKTKDTGVSLTYINNNYIRSDGTTPVSGSIDMRGNTLYNVPNPVNPQDVATKEYTDNVEWGNSAIVKTQQVAYVAIENIDMRFYTLKNVRNPEDAQDVATKQYADTASKAFIYDKDKYLAITKLPNGKFTAVSDIDFNGFSLKNIPEPIDEKDAVNKAYVDNKTIQPAAPIKPIINVWAKEKGPLGDGHYEFSFGNGSSGSEHAYGGYCMSAPGRIIRGSLTATESINILSEEVKVNIVVNGKEQVNQSIVKKSGDICSCTIFRDPIELKQCDIINFISRTTNNKITNAYVPILIELDL